MHLQRRALYNCLRFNADRGQLGGGQFAPWQLICYRNLEQEELFTKLSELGVTFHTKQTFCEYGEDFETPEEMAERLAEGKTECESDHIYLLIFELWRRFLPEKRSPSIFCDALDHEIQKHELGKLSSHEILQEELLTLKQILDDHVEMGHAPDEVMHTLQSYCAHELETFLYDYISELIHSNQDELAKELTEGFYPYVQEGIWFDILIARLELKFAPENVEERFVALIERVNRLDIAEELLELFANQGLHTHFCDLIDKCYPLLETEEDLGELIKIVGKHFTHLEMVDAYKALYNIAAGKSSLSQKPLRKNDRDLQALKKLFSTIKV